MSYPNDGGTVAQNNGRSGKSGPEVLIVGPYPPPLGGVSSHVQRAAAALGEAGLTVGVLNHFSSHAAGSTVIGSLRRNPILYFTKLRGAHAGVVHYHHAGRPSLLLAVAAARHRRDESSWLVTLHNHSLERHLAKGPLAPLVRWALGRFDQIVAVSSEIGRFLAEHGVQTPIVVQPAYVPSHARSPIDPGGRWTPTPFFDRPGITLVVSAYRVVRFDGVRDLYGLDVAAHTFAALAKDRAELRLAIFLSHPPRGRWAKRHLTSLLEGVGPELSERVGVWVGEQLAPAFRPGVLYLRPTQTDGDAVSVREALDCEVPVIASDCSARPAGVTTVRYGDGPAWRETVASVLAELASKHTVIPASETPTSRGEQDVLDLYRSHIVTANSCRQASRT